MGMIEYKNPDEHLYIHYDSFHSIHVLKLFYIHYKASFYHLKKPLQLMLLYSIAN